VFAATTLLLMLIDIIVGLAALVMGALSLAFGIAALRSVTGQGFEARYCLFYGQTYSLPNFPDFVEITMLGLPFLLLTGAVVLLAQALLHLIVLIQAENNDEFAATLRSHVIIGGLCVLWALAVPAALEGLIQRIEQAEALTTCSLTPTQSALLLRIVVFQSAPLILGIGAVLLATTGLYYLLNRPSKSHFQRPVMAEPACALCGITAQAGCVLCHAGLRMRVQDRLSREDLRPARSYTLERTQIKSLELIPEGADALHSQHYRLWLNWSGPTELQTVAQDSAWQPADKQGHEWLYYPPQGSQMMSLRLDLIARDALADTQSTSNAFGLKITAKGKLRVTMMLRPESTSTLWSQPFVLEFDE
jgi:hypothetical protein